MTIVSVPAPLIFRAHGDQEVRQVDDLGFTSSVLEDRPSFGQSGRHHQVLGAGHRDRLEHDPRAVKAPCAGLDVAVLDVDVRSHRLQPGDVNVDRASADRTATGQRDVGRAVPRDQRPEDQDRRAHRLDEFVGGEGLARAPGVHLDAHALVDRHPGAEPAEQFDHRGHVLQVRDVRDVTGSSGSSAAARIGSAAFLAPDMRTSPSSGTPPRICSLSMSADYRAAAAACHSAGE